MGKINLLQGHLAELIAAGEVVERPSSVIKELVENAIDSGSNAITVEIKDGGISFMRVSDNGSGIDKDDIKVAFLRHATSKIAKEEDLSCIGTLGFRGEALAAISSVCKVELMSKTTTAQTGYRYCVHGGQELSFEECGCPVGTTIVVRDIFYNTPARMKFLKKNVTEGNAVEAVIMRVALSNPQISVSFIRDGVRKLHTPGNGKLMDTIYQIYGREVAAGLLPVDETSGNYKITGFICSPQSAKSNRTMQHFYVNGRYVKTKTAMVAMEQGYKNVLMSGKFPYCFLFIEMPLQLVDVNVHPAKIEVRFANENELFQAVYTAVRAAILTQSQQMARANLPVKENELTYQKPTAPQPVSKPSFDYRTTPTFSRYQGNQQVMSSPDVQPMKSQSAFVPPAPVFDFKPQTQKEQVLSQIGGKIEIPAQKPAQTTVPLPSFDDSAPKQDTATDPQNVCVPTVIGQLFGTYIVAQAEDRVFLFDKHAAHERILFEKLKQNYTHIDSQVLLSPLTVNLSPENTDAVEQNLQLLSHWGFGIDIFGMTAIIVREIPSFFSGENIVSVVEEIASNLQKGLLQLQSDKLDWLFNNTACRAAIKAGQYTHTQQLQTLVDDIYRLDMIKYCPHGRPIVIELTKSEIEKRFGRV